MDQCAKYSRKVFRYQAVKQVFESKSTGTGVVICLERGANDLVFLEKRLLDRYLSFMINYHPKG